MTETIWILLRDVSHFGVFELTICLFDEDFCQLISCHCSLAKLRSVVSDTIPVGRRVKITISWCLFALAPKF